MKINYVQIIIGVLVGLLISYLIFHEFGEMKNSENLIERHLYDNSISLTNPILECSGVDSDESLKQLNISRFELEGYIKQLKKDGNNDFISFYLRDLNNGPWIGFDEKEDFIGASLLKVPVLIAYFKIAQENKDLLDQEYVYTEKFSNFDQIIKPEKEIELGKSYKVSELIEYMINYSDNSAAQLLAVHLTDNQINSVFESIGLGSPLHSINFPVNVRNYGGFFRVLFNASYLNKDFSEKALLQLTQTKFDKGLTKYLPKNITVAHKFGVREVGEIKQFHDCGIVYYPKHPYLICIMTKGSNVDRLTEKVAKISEFVYKKIDINNPSL